MMIIFEGPQGDCPWGRKMPLKFFFIFQNTHLCVTMDMRQLLPPSSPNPLIGGAKLDSIRCHFPLKPL